MNQLNSFECLRKTKATSSLPTLLSICYVAKEQETCEKRKTNNITVRSIKTINKPTLNRIKQYLDFKSEIRTNKFHTKIYTRLYK